MSELSQVGISEREAYLDDVDNRLRKQLSALERFELITEFRQHLDAMAEAFVELGMPPGQAMQAAIEKFGASSNVATQISKASERPFADHLVRVASASFSAMIAGTLALVLLEQILLATRIVEYGDLTSDVSVGIAFGMIAGPIVGLTKLRPLQAGLVSAGLALLAYSPVAITIWTLGNLDRMLFPLAIACCGFVAGFCAALGKAGISRMSTQQ